MKNELPKLTSKEEEVMSIFWSKGSMFVRELLKEYDDPKPHFNTLSTVVRGLEDKGYLAHRSYGSSYQYYAAVSHDEFRALSLSSFINKYYNNSIYSAVSALVKSEAISVKELSELIELIEKE